MAMPGGLFTRLPTDVRLRLIHRGNSHFPVVNSSSGGPPQWVVQVRDNVELEFANPQLLDEMIFRLDRALGRNSIRVLRLNPNHTENVASLGRRTDGGLPVADDVNPARLDAQLRPIRGQTAIISGRVEGDVLIADVGKSGESRTSLKSKRPF